MDLPKPPKFLKADAKKIYERIGEMLIEENNFKNGDEISLSCLCANYQRWIEAEKAISKNKELCFTTDSGYRQQIPEISIANNAMKELLSFIKEFALTPKERSKLRQMIFTNSDNTDEELDDMIAK